MAVRVIYARTDGSYVAVADGRGRTFLVDHRHGPDLERHLAAFPAVVPTPELIAQVAFDRALVEAGKVFDVTGIVPASNGRSLVASTHWRGADLDLAPTEAATLRLAMPRPGGPA